MTDFSEDPFQMDEDLPYDKINNDITPQYPELNDASIHIDQQTIRSRVQELEPVQYDEDLDDKFISHSNETAKDYTTLKTLQQNQPMTPPENFAPVINNIYRSSFPQANNFSFLKRLKLKSILCLIPEDYPDIHRQFLEEENIKLFQLGLSGNKEPFVVISHDLVTEALKIVLDPENQPILIHCNRGKHRTGCLVGILRRLQKWSLTIIFDEYRKFAAPKERPMDQQFIELYDETEIVNYSSERSLLPLSWDGSASLVQLDSVQMD